MPHRAMSSPGGPSSPLLPSALGLRLRQIFGEPLPPLAFLAHYFSALRVEMPDQSLRPAEPTPLSAPDATVRTLSLECHPAYLPSLVSCFPRLAMLAVVFRMHGLVEHAALLRDIAATIEQCPHLRQLDLHLPSGVTTTAPALTLTPDELTALRLGPVLTSLTACMAFPDPNPVLPAWLRCCSLTLMKVPPVLTLDLPQVEELSLEYLAPTLLRLRCPQLRSFNTVDYILKPMGAEADVVAVEGLMPHLGQITADILVPVASWDAFFRFFLPLVLASREPLDLSLILPSRRSPALDDLPIADSWRVRSLTVTGSSEQSVGCSLRLPTSVAHLVLKDLQTVSIVGPGVRLIEWQNHREDATCLSLATPQLDTLIIRAGLQPQVTFTPPSLPAPVRTLAVWLEKPNLRALAALVRILRETLEVLVAKTSAPHRPALSLDGPALRRVFSDTPIRFLTACPCSRKGPKPL
ncbi:hypothetical protein PAPYR_4484 [Paratrimastix pyriformis]|uniref:F-box domain-containing protein n=1 Tax=Paratrimastix pyriformis TaxID=342808 RepID=A0ABQ8UMD1_9EUKA|nr:hypothetical protein PAPYR_4484 [Paratrimastix pyriformis]